MTDLYSQALGAEAARTRPLSGATRKRATPASSGMEV